MELPSQEDNSVGHDWNIDYSKKPTTKRKCILTSAVLLILTSVIIASVVIMITSDKKSSSKSQTLKLEEILNGIYSPVGFKGTWISDNQIILLDTDNNLRLVDIDKIKPKGQKLDIELDIEGQILVDNQTLIDHLVFSLSQISLSPDADYLLFYNAKEKVYRHSFLATYWIYNIKTKSMIQLIPPQEGVTQEETQDETQLVKLQYAEWGPIGKQLVFVFKNNIYYVSNVNDLSPTSKNAMKQLTSDGSFNYLNGVPDWVYEEEILSSNHAIWWSNEGTALCFASFNDENVENFSFPLYGDYIFSDQNVSNLNHLDTYSKIINIKYPRPGRKNPEIILRIVDLSQDLSNQTYFEVKPTPEMIIDLNDDYYVTSVSWSQGNNKKSSSILSVTWLNRSQNVSIISLCSQEPAQKTWNCAKNLREENKFGWLDVNEKLFLSQNYYFLRLSKSENDLAGNFKHIAMVSIKDASKKIFLTSGHFDVTQILALREDKDTQVIIIYYLSTLEGKPGERHFYRLEIEPKRDSNKVKSNKCLTCETQCLYNSVILSKNAKYYIHNCAGPDIPKITLRKSEDNLEISTLQDNQVIKEILEHKLVPKIKKLVINHKQYNLSVQLFLPPSLDENESTSKYPLLVQVYGGPGSQMVTERFQINWGSYLASDRNIIYALIDGRGSGYQGDKILHALYRNLGTVEIEDQIEIAKFLRDNFGYIKPDAIGIWGWSYGGYAAAMALAKDQNIPPVFSCGVSVAPVTNWLLYDSVYTERYMSLPQDNAQSYLNSSSLLSDDKLQNLGKKKFLLIHGSSDDNVHLQQSMLLIKALTHKNIMFESQLYTDENHSLSGVNFHLYKRMQLFWNQCFKLD